MNANYCSKCLSRTTFKKSRTKRAAPGF
ncbi:MAG: zinc-finger domain-containing protein [Methylocystis sp.]